MAEVKKGKSPKDFAGMLLSLCLFLQTLTWHVISRLPHGRRLCRTLFRPRCPSYSTDMNSLGCRQDIRGPHRAYQAPGSEPG
jgi:hypothetical protein